MIRKEVEREFIKRRGSAWISPKAEVFPTNVGGHSYELWNNPRIHRAIPWMEEAHRLLEAHIASGPPRLDPASYSHRTRYANVLEDKAVAALYASGFVRLCPVRLDQEECVEFEASGTVGAVQARRRLCRELAELYALAAGYRTSKVGEHPMPFRPEDRLWDPSSGLPAKS